MSQQHSGRSDLKKNRIETAPKFHISNPLATHRVQLRPTTSTAFPRTPTPGGEQTRSGIPSLARINGSVQLQVVGRENGVQLPIRDEGQRFQGLEDPRRGRDRPLPGGSWPLSDELPESLELPVSRGRWGQSCIGVFCQERRGPGHLEESVHGRLVTDSRESKELISNSRVKRESGFRPTSSVRGRCADIHFLEGVQPLGGGSHVSGQRPAIGSLPQCSIHRPG